MVFAADTKVFVPLVDTRRLPSPVWTQTFSGSLLTKVYAVIGKHNYRPTNPCSTAYCLINAVTGQVALIAVAERLRNYLELILIHDVAYSFAPQHLHGDDVVLKNADQISNVGDMRRCRVLEP